MKVTKQRTIIEELEIPVRLRVGVTYVIHPTQVYPGLERGKVQILQILPFSELTQEQKERYTDMWLDLDVEEVEYPDYVVEIQQLNVDNKDKNYFMCAEEFVNSVTWY